MTSRGGNGLAWALLAIAGCGEHRSSEEQAAPAAETSAPAEKPAPDLHVAEPAQAPCTDPVLHVEAGIEKGWLCPAVATALGLTPVDLSEKWAPLPFSPIDAKPPRFRETYLALAAEGNPDGGELPPEERLVEMYGITPAPSIALRRLGDERRHACHAAIDSSVLAKVHRTLSEAPNRQVESTDRKRRWMGARVRKLGKRAPKSLVAQWQRLQDEHDAVVAVQQHLVCEKLFGKKFVDGKLTWMTAKALDYYQRAHFLLPHGQLDADTREALAAGELEHDFRAALRMLRERVVDATGLIEDGTAGDGPVPVLGRQLEPDTMRHAKGRGPLPDAAPDLIDPATERAAIALGWTSAEGARDWLARHRGEQVVVAIALPPPPAYHSAHMELHAVVDRGDVWYELKPHWHTPAKRPALVLYAKDGDVDRPLVQWPTTIGGWADQRKISGRVKKEWKESDVGPRVWKDLFVAPTWQPPRTTPDDDLVKNLWNGHYRLRTEVLGPGPRSAYGMVMLINHREYKVGGKKKKKVLYADNGIRVHGSASVTSVIRGNSHGCHRLLNHLAVRLGAFLLRHRDHQVRGEQKTWWKRIVRFHGTFEAKVMTRGYLYELTPPVPVEVTKGRIRSARKKPPPKHGWASP